MDFFTKGFGRHLSSQQLRELAALCAGASLLVAVALVLSGSILLPGPLKLAVQNIKQTAAVGSAAAVATYSTPGSTTWTAPAGVTQVAITVVGGGGGAGSSQGQAGGCDPSTGASGGAGGAIVKQVVSVTPNQTYNIVVGQGGAGGIVNLSGCGNGVNGSAGTQSSFNVAYVATGGAGGSGTNTNIEATAGTPYPTTMRNCYWYDGNVHYLNEYAAYGCYGGVYAGGTSQYSQGGYNGSGHGSGGNGYAGHYSGDNGQNGYVEISYPSITASNQAVSPPGSSVITYSAQGIDPGSCTVTGPSGTVYTEPSTGWTQRTQSGSWYGYDVASDGSGQNLAAASYGGDIYLSHDYGASWAPQNMGPRNWFNIVSSQDGSRIVAAAYNGYLYLYTTSSGTWTPLVGGSVRQWHGLATDATGDVLVGTIANGGYIWVSHDYGSTWLNQSPGATTWFNAALNGSDGSKIVTGVYGGGLWQGAYSGSGSTYTWNNTNNDAGAHGWTGFASDSTGTRLAATEGPGGYIWLSSNSGVNWRAAPTDRQNFYGIASSQDGTKIAAATDGSDYIYLSQDGGASWQKQTAPGAAQWYGIASNADGSRLIAAPANAALWTYFTDFGIVNGTYNATNITSSQTYTISCTAGGTPISAQTTVSVTPSVTSISPTSGAASGGTSVTITGTNFNGATGVKFGNTSATSYTINSATSITATSPAGSGTVDIYVTNPAGTSVSGAGDKFTYVIPTATITASPTSVTETSGQNSTIVANLSAPAAVDITVNFNVTSTATKGTDFTLAPDISGSTGSVVIPAGQTTADITVLTSGYNGSFGTSNKTVTITPTSGTGYTASTAAVVTITPPLCTAALGGGATGTWPGCGCNISGWGYTAGTNTCAAPGSPTCSITYITSPTASGGTATIGYKTTNTPTVATTTYTLPSGVTASPSSTVFTPGASTTVSTGTLTDNNTTATTTGIILTVGNASGTATCQGSTIVQNVPFNFSLSMASEQIVPGGQNTQWAYALRSSGAAQSVGSFSVVSGLPVGSTWASSPDTCTPASHAWTLCTKLTLSVPANATPGTYPVVLQATGGGVTSQTTFNLYVVPFSFSLAAPNVTVTLGSSTPSTVSATLTGGTAGIINSFTATNLPTGVTASFSPASCTPSDANCTTMTLTADPSTVPGTYTPGVQAAISGNGSAVSSTNFTLTVSTFNFSLSASPSTVTVLPGSSASTTVQAALSQ